MATKNDPKIVTEFPTVGRQATYPWDEWTDGKIRELVKGVHFKGAVRSMRQTCAKYAQKNGLTVKTRSLKDGSRELLYVQFTRR